MRNISGKEKSWGFMKQGGRWGRLVLLVLGVSSAPNGKDFLTLALGWEHRAYVNLSSTLTDKISWKYFLIVSYF